MPLSVVILTFNSAASIARTLRSVMTLSDDLHVVDSGSSDDTVAICERLGCTVVDHPFDNYAAQRNWAIDTLPLKNEWQLHLDADEELEPGLRDAIARLDLDHVAADGFIIGRKIVFMGRVLRFGDINKSWHYRLFRRGFGRCEDRLYDQHFVASGRVERIDGFVLDHQEQTLADWTARHNRWSDMEAAEIAGGGAETRLQGQITPRLGGTAIERKRYAKGRYYELPLFWRVFAYSFYRYVIRLGFLDGKPGLIYHALQGFWFRMLVDAKIYEMRVTRDQAGTGSPAK